MKSIEISRKSWLFRLALWGFYGWNWNLIDEIIDDVNHNKRWSSHRGRNFTTCDLLYGFPMAFLTALSLLIVFVILVILCVMISSLMILFDIGRVLFGYKPAWTVIDFFKSILKDVTSDIDDFRRTDDWLMWRNDILTLRPIYFLAAGHFLYLMFFDSNATYFNGQSQIFQIGIEFLALVFVWGMALKIVVSIIWKSGSFLLEKYRERHPKNSEENSPSLVKLVLQSVHEKTCRQLDIKD
jgi:hypothetical protein